jgi:hypothetical protein
MYDLQFVLQFVLTFIFLLRNSMIVKNLKTRHNFQIDPIFEALTNLSLSFKL